MRPATERPHLNACSGNGDCRAGKAQLPEVFGPGPGSVADVPHLYAVGAAVADERRAETAHNRQFQGGQGGNVAVLEIPDSGRLQAGGRSVEVPLIMFQGFCKMHSRRSGHRKSYDFTTNHPRISKERHHDLDA